MQNAWRKSGAPSLECCLSGELHFLRCISSSLGAHLQVIDLCHLFPLEWILRSRLFLTEALAVLHRHKLFFSCRLSRLGTCLHFCREPVESKTLQRQRSSFVIYQLEISTEFLLQGHFLYVYFQSSAFICAIRVRTKELPHCLLCFVPPASPLWWDIGDAVPVPCSWITPWTLSILWRTAPLPVKWERRSDKESQFHLNLLFDRYQLSIVFGFTIHAWRNEGEHRWQRGGGV